MEVVKERRRASNLTRYYRADDLADGDAIIRRLCDIRAIEGLDISYIVLRDLVNRSEEGSDTLRLSGNAQIEELQRELQAREVDMISLDGTFMGKPIVIGAGLRNLELFVTVRLNNKADIDAIEKELSL